MVETLDGGKPIRESRDVDLPLAAAHLFHHAGWADKLRVRASRAARCGRSASCGQIIPWNFPLLMAAWKIAPGARLRQHRRAEAGRDDAADRAAAGRDHARRRSCRRASSTSSPAAGETGAALVAPSRRGQGRLHRLDRRRQAHPARARRHRTKRLTLELGGKAANIVFADAALDQAVEGIVNGIYFNQGHVCCAGSRLLVEESVARRRRRKLATGCRRCGWAIRSTRTPTSARSTRRCSSRGSASSSRPARRRAPSASARLRAPDKGFWFRPRSSPTRASRTGSRARRSSARSSP